VLVARLRSAVFLLALLPVSTVPVAAQRVPFERAIDVMPGATLDVTTVRGRIDITTHDVRQIRVDGTVTVRVSSGFTTTAVPLDLARRVAEHPRIDVAGNVVRLRPPSDADELRAVTVSYQVRVPRDTTIVIGTDSGAVNVDGTSAPVTVATESSEITLSRLAGMTAVKTASGDVKVDGASGGLRVVTQSSAVTARGLSGVLEARTQSGAVRASFAGAGSADVETGSSAVRLDGLSGRVAVRTQSGRVDVRGAPTANWDVTTGSSVIEADFEPSAKFTLEATSRSSSVRLDGISVDGVTAKERVSGKVGGGGPTVRLATRSGQIHIGH
jgi:DUF4097 and DUF4098 domain-containing protein YvlB